MALLIQYTLIFSAVLILVALGGMFSERSGIINLGLEGIMVFGAMAGAMVMVLLPQDAYNLVKKLKENRFFTTYRYCLH